MARGYWGVCPEFIERVGRRYQRIKEFCVQNGFDRDMLWHRLKKYGEGHRLHVDGIQIGARIGRWYVNVKEIEKVRKRGKAFEDVPREIQRNGKNYLLRAVYCAENGIPKGTVIEHIGKDKLEAMKIMIGETEFWYIFNGIAKGTGRINYLRRAWRRIRVVKKVVERCEEVGGEDSKKELESVVSQV